MPDSHRKILSAGLALAILLLPASRVWAQQHLVDRSALRQTLSERLSADEQNRAAIAGALARPEAQRLASALGLDLKRAEHAVAALEGAELAELAATARAVTTDRAGEASTITISITTLLLLLILIVLIAS
jgi:hypothetical protein